MNVFDNYTRTVLEELISKNVEFIVVGGYAVNLYGYRRPTGDIDILLKPDNISNKQKLLSVFNSLNIPQSAIEKVNNLDFEKAQVFRDGEEPFRIDFLTKISGVSFDEAWDQRNSVELDGLIIPFIHLKHLILSKVSSERMKDKIDIEELQKIRNLKK